MAGALPKTSESACSGEEIQVAVHRIERDTRPPTIAETSAVSAVLRVFPSSIFSRHAGRELSSFTVHPSIFHRPPSCTRYQVPSLCWISPVSVAWVSPVTVAVLPEITAFGPSMNTTLST